MKQEKKITSEPRGVAQMPSEAIKGLDIQFSEGHSTINCWAVQGFVHISRNTITIGGGTHTIQFHGENSPQHKQQLSIFQPHFPKYPQQLQAKMEDVVSYKIV